MWRIYPWTWRLNTSLRARSLGASCFLLTARTQHTENGAGCCAKLNRLLLKIRGRAGERNRSKRTDSIFDFFFTFFSKSGSDSLTYGLHTLQISPPVSSSSVRLNVSTAALAPPCGLIFEYVSFFVVITSMYFLSEIGLLFKYRFTNKLKQLHVC